jgi:hypothetical protein
MIIDENKFFDFLIENQEIDPDKFKEEAKCVHDLVVKYQELAYSMAHNLYQSFSEDFPPAENGYSNPKRVRAYELTLIWTGFLLGIDSANREK